MSQIPDLVDTGNPEFQDALNLIKYTNSSVFLTGRAGTGKSTFLKYICQTIHKKHVVLAPTGITAINAGGVTIHSFFKVPFRPILPNDPDLSGKDKRVHDFLKYNKDKIKLIKEVELLIIDEISMVRCDILDFIDQVSRIFSRDKNQPFGGKQLLLVGDAFQLEPVVKKEEWQILGRHYKTPYFFSAVVFQHLKLVQVELLQVYRQNDPAFVDILDNIRQNQAQQHHLDILNKRLREGYQVPVNELAITLATRREEVDHINSLKLDQLAGRESRFEGTISGDFPGSSLPTLENLALKKNAQVMFVKNDMERRWYNGSLGRVEEITNQGIKVRMENNEIHLVTIEKWENLRYKFDDENKRVITTEIGSFKQYPLKPAWAITVHKCQGLTFDKVLVDFSGGAFAGGQLYVALSRCRSLEGLVLKTPVLQRDIIVNRHVKEFAASANNRQLIDDQLKKARADNAYAAALASFRDHNWKETVKYLAEAVSSRNDLTKPWMQKFMAREMLFVNHYKNQVTQLEFQLEESKRIAREFAREYYLMANECEVKFKDTRSAIANLNKALKLDPLCPDALLRRANLLKSTGDAVSAEADCTVILEIKQRHFNALLLRGKIRLQLANLSGAYNDLLEAQGIDKTKPEVYRALAKVCAKMGETRKSREYQRKARDLEGQKE